jgi:AhpD family alkylhydroperoxidase
MGRTNVSFVEPSEATGEVKKIYDMVQEKRGFIGPAFRALANKPEVLRMFANRIAMVWDTETKLDQKTKWLVYLAVSIMNNCEGCIFSFSDLLKSIGVSDEELVELYSIIDAACGMNMLLTGAGIKAEHLRNAMKEAEYKERTKK